MLHQGAVRAQALSEPSTPPDTLQVAYLRAAVACDALAELAVATAHPALAHLNAYARAELTRVHNIRAGLGQLLALAGLPAPVNGLYELTAAGRNARAMTAAPLPDTIPEQPTRVDVGAAFAEARATLDAEQLAPASGR